MASDVPTVALVEDQALVRELTCDRLREHYRGAGCMVEIVAFAGVAELLIAGLEPSIVVLDLQLEGQRIEGAAAVRACRRRGWPVLVLSGLHTQEALDSAFDAGALGFVSKDVPDVHDIATAVEWVIAGRQYVHPMLLDRIDAAEHRSLSPRQRQVLRLEALGRTTGQIATELGLSGAGVRRHIEAIVAARPGCAKQTERVRLAVRLGLITPWEAYRPPGRS